jgi:diadenylate cyclase
MEFITTIYSSMRWQDVLDIGINSYILFRFYVLFRGTNVLRVLFGLACIWFAQKIAVSMGLIVTSWISQGIIAAAALILIVIFRNEIRAVLQTKNIKAILWELPHKSITTPVEIIVNSVFELSRKQIGALIVLPGKDNLEDLVQSGIEWQGVVSREMITSIFWPDNPVHDGAVLIQGNRVQQVGCILPLSKRSDLPSRYGTRHRAALGLAENSDALVIVVSEERGDILVAQASRLITIRRKDTLERRLREHAGMRLRPGHRLLYDKLEMGLASIVSVIFIMGIWFGITRGLDILDSFEVPVEYMNRDPEKEIVDTSVNSVILRLGGSRSLIRSLSPDQLRVTIDLSNSVTGKNSFAITRDNITLPAGVILKDVIPETLEVNLDVLTQKDLPIQADWVGKMDDNLILTEAKLTPDKVTIIGGKQLLENLTTLYTEKIPVDALSESGTLTVTLAYNPAKLKIASGSKNKVTISYVIMTRVQL